MGEVVQFKTRDEDFGSSSPLPRELFVSYSVRCAVVVANSEVHQYNANESIVLMALDEPRSGDQVQALEDTLRDIYSDAENFPDLSITLLWWKLLG